MPFLAKVYDKDCKEDGYGCSKIILNHEPDFKNIEFLITNEGLSIKPWDCNIYPEWWTVYNELKHHRSSYSEKVDKSKKNYQLANLKNTINALAGLYALELFAYRKLAIEENNNLIVPNIKTIFTTKNLYWKDISFGSGMVLIGECLNINTDFFI